MASSTGSAARRTVITTVVILAILAILLAAMAVLYFIVTRPPSFATGGTKDRNYLFSIYGFQGDLLRRPSSVGIDSQGNIYVADTGKRRIVVFDPAGKFVATYGDPGQGPNQIWEPISVAVAPDGRSYVVDKTLKKIVIYDVTHKPIKEIDFKDEAPLSVRVANGQLFVTTPSGVVIGSLDGQFQTGYISKGKKSGQFDTPGAVAVGSDGTLYVADTLNYRIQAIGTNGKVKWVYGASIPASQAVQYQGADRKFGLPSSIAIDGNGFLYVVDGLSSQLVVLDSSGQLVETIGDVGHADGTFYYPDGIDYGNGRLVVADKFNDRIEVFSDPTARSFGDTAAMYWPWALLLLLIPLALLPLLLRRRHNYVVAPAFAEALAGVDHGDEIAGTLKRVIATEPVVNEHGKDFENLKWVSRDIDDKTVADLVKKYELAQADAEAVAIAMSVRGQVVLLSQDDDVNRAAAELGVTTLTVEQMLDALATDSEGVEAS